MTFLLQCQVKIVHLLANFLHNFFYKIFITLKIEKYET